MQQIVIPNSLGRFRDSGLDYDGAVLLLGLARVAQTRIVRVPLSFSTVAESTN